MNNFWSKQAVKFKLFLPVFIGIIITISIITYFSIDRSKKNISESLESNLSLEVKTIMKMFERERALKLDKVKTDLKVAHDYFYSKEFIIEDVVSEHEITNQISKQKHIAKLKSWKWNNKELLDDFSFVDKIQSMLGGTVTIFQKSDSGCVRISTNVLDENNQRAIFTYIPNYSEVSQSTGKGETYFGRAFVVNAWYITAYEPIKYNNKIVGNLYVGSKEKDLDKLRSIISELKIGESGFPFVFDKDGNIIMHPKAEGENWSNKDFIKEITSEQTNGILRYQDENSNGEQIVAFDYFPDFKLYIAASINEKEETKDLIQELIFSSVIIAILIIIALSVIVYFYTTKNLFSFLEKLEKSNIQLNAAKEALAHTQKMANMGQLSAGIAHEVNNPIGVILLHTELLKEQLEENSQAYIDVELIESQAKRTKDIMSGLLNFARESEINIEKVDNKKMFDKILEELIIPDKTKISINISDEAQTAFIDETQMINVFSHLIKNAIEATSGKGEIHISAFHIDSDIIYTVEDNGCGISETNRKKLFEPFFSTKEGVQAKGLGLAVCYGIIKIHKGNISVESNNDKSKGKTGTKFIIGIPAEKGFK
ncbi:MAG: Cache 3/Cache 2 fusion domain-containing protein [Saprospiraceae bacterium]|nr:Cache 3/Cache 2 fusion domain-containing protein [Saprospiraceae bacterium]